MKEPNPSTPTGARNLAIMQMIGMTGLSSSEIVSLEVSDIDKGSRTIKVRGDGDAKDREVPYYDALNRYLDDWERFRPKSASYFCTTMKGAGNPISSSFLRSMLIRYARRADIRDPGDLGKQVSPHVLRHTFAVFHYRQHRDLGELRKILGHSSSRTTEIYRRILPPDCEVMENVKAPPWAYI